MFFGHSWLAGQIANVLLGSSVVLLTFMIGRLLLPPFQARIATVLVAFSPSLIAYTAVLGTETLFSALLLLLLLIVVRHGPQPTMSASVLFGVVLGLTWWVRGTLLLYPGILIVAMLISGVGIRRSARTFAMVFLVAFIVIFPWTVRNAIVLDAPVLISTNGGTNFWKGNNPDATGAWMVLPESDPLKEYADASEEATRNREGYLLGLRYITSHPIEWTSILPKKVWHLWASDMSGVSWSTQSTERVVPARLITTMKVVAQSYWAVLVVLVLSTILFRPLRLSWLSFPGNLLPLTIVYWTLFHMLLFGDGRFHLPLIPVFAILATQTVFCVSARWLSPPGFALSQRGSLSRSSSKDVKS